MKLGQFRSCLQCNLTTNNLHRLETIPTIDRNHLNLDHVGNFNRLELYHQYKQSKTQLLFHHIPIRDHLDLLKLTALQKLRLEFKDLTVRWQSYRIA